MNQASIHIPDEAGADRAQAGFLDYDENQDEGTNNSAISASMQAMSMDFYDEGSSDSIFSGKSFTQEPPKAVLQPVTVSNNLQMYEEQFQHLNVEPTDEIKLRILSIVSSSSDFSNFRSNLLNTIESENKRIIDEEVIRIYEQENLVGLIGVDLTDQQKKRGGKKGRTSYNKSGFAFQKLFLQG